MRHGMEIELEWNGMEWNWNGNGNPWYSVTVIPRTVFTNDLTQLNFLNFERSKFHTIYKKIPLSLSNCYFISPNIFKIMFYAFIMKLFRLESYEILAKVAQDRL